MAKTTLGQGKMTSGSIPRQLIYFALPLLLGNVFQQLYNAVDSAVVGRYVGSQALAAVSSANPIINMVLAFFTGIAVGGSVVVAQAYGAGDQEAVDKSVHTFMAVTFVAGVLTTAIGVGLSPQLLQMIGTPADVFTLAVQYFRVYFAGSMFMVIYNMASALMRAVGDSRHPLYFLIASSVVNILLDLLFVIVFQWGVAGAAFATVVAQGVSAVWLLISLKRERRAFRFYFRKLQFHPPALRAILSMGIPTGVQNAVVSVSNLIVQSSINQFGSLAVAGCGSCTKIDGFVGLSIQSAALAITTFVGQNMGAKEYQRADQGRKTGTLLSMGTCLVLSGLMCCFAPQLIGLFTEEEAVVGYGVGMIHIMVTGYLPLAYTQCSAGALRGAGLSKVPMLSMIACFCGLRVMWILGVARPMHSLPMVLMGYPISWWACALVMLVYLKRTDWMHKVTIVPREERERKDI